MNHRSRVDRLEVLWRSRWGAHAELPRLDLAALSQDDVLTLDDLLAVGQRSQRRPGTTDWMAGLSPGQRVRPESLIARVKVATKNSRTVYSAYDSSGPND